MGVGSIISRLWLLGHGEPGKRAGMGLEIDSESCPELDPATITEPRGQQDTQIRGDEGELKGGSVRLDHVGPERNDSDVTLDVPEVRDNAVERRRVAGRPGCEGRAKQREAEHGAPTGDDWHVTDSEVERQPKVLRPVAGRLVHAHITASPV